MSDSIHTTGKDLRNLTKREITEMYNDPNSTAGADLQSVPDEFDPIDKRYNRDSPEIGANEEIHNYVATLFDFQQVRPG
ncbi:MAG: hypothetical protein M0R39_14595 [Prolixibacteraceae bacterium]|jgi:hypothetical protein|nr:hypothetical protein [Prolixibacteraceae bacterium]